MSVPIIWKRGYFFLNHRLHFARRFELYAFHQSVTQVEWAIMAMIAATAEGLSHYTDPIVDTCTGARDAMLG